MKARYHDILSRIPEKPLWHDQNGVPRYDEFHPELCPDVYSDQVVLMEIACAHCDRTFAVEMHSNIWGSASPPKQWHYGFPPEHDCVGDTMNAWDNSIMQAWYRQMDGEWVRREDLEGDID